MARREAREYREYLSAEQRSQPGCPALELCREPRGQDTRSHLTNGVPTRTRKHENAKTRNNLKVFFFVVSCFRGFVIVRVYETRSRVFDTLCPMSIRTELNLRLPNSPGALAGVCRLMSDERVNIVALMLESGGQMRMVVDNHVHAAAVLREHHHQVTEREVILVTVPNTPGALAPALKLLADANVNIEYAYAGVADTNQMASIVVGTEHVMNAAAAAGV